ncbi:conserved hypothetical protein [Theileria orientalis strain Shintoku]|uniref:Uncharacterized protein n=1 Tax=Theileria orientalis strain Shintoku TaxID=869250 RepID=J4CDR8_THEOR|nr:conserved hypothetical protein [Theileria orientalis strain Shintoku]PVC52667.1 hypothetical protein MACL_00000617 [Theileria orientalis]BAM41617.1 conserved hypothetical protein [Theileria orientalis strain Shintoku]|eukprot:XP_009691918.1 conserved hypothetical protein [Theileria orientalis strain Shintoku]
MYNVTFDLSKNVRNPYSDKEQILITKPKSDFQNYTFIQHLISYPKFEKTVEFQIKFVNGDTITVDSSGFTDGPYKVTRLELYYNDENKNPLIFGVIIQPQSGNLGTLTQYKLYYKFRELTSCGNTKTVRLADLTQVELEEENLDYECKAVNTTVVINPNHGEGDYKAEIEKINPDLDASSVEVHVKGPEQTGNNDFVMYTYTLKGGGFTKLEFKSKDYIFNLIGFNGSNFNDINLDNITVYYASNDSQRNFPLLIRFIPKTDKHFGDNHKNNSICYELKSINEIRSNDKTNKWNCKYSTTSCLGSINTELQSIYRNENIKGHIEKLIGSNNGPRVAATIIGVLGAISIPVGLHLDFSNKSGAEEVPEYYTLKISNKVYEKGRNFIKVTYNIHYHIKIPSYCFYLFFAGQFYLFIRNKDEYVFTHSVDYISEIVKSIDVYFSVLNPDEPLVVTFHTKQPKTYNYVYRTLKKMSIFHSSNMNTYASREPLNNELITELSNLSNGVLFHTSTGRSTDLKRIPKEPDKRDYVGGDEKFHRVIFTCTGNNRSSNLYIDKLFPEGNVSGFSSLDGHKFDGLLVYYRNDDPVLIEFVEGLDTRHQYVSKDSKNWHKDEVLYTDDSSLRIELDKLPVKFATKMTLRTGYSNERLEHLHGIKSTNRILNILKN